MSGPVDLPAPDSSPDGWLVAVDELAYGPYRPDQLSSFLTHDHWVFHESIGDWMKAREVFALRDVLAGKIDPSLEWYYRSEIDSGEHGPFTREAIVKMALQRTIPATAFIRHESWTEPQALLETKLARDAGVRGARESLARPAEASPAPPRRRARGEVPRWAAVIAALAVIAAVWGGYSVYWSMNTTPKAIRSCGSFSGNCVTDKTSRCLCEQEPSLCGCQGSSRGRCGMASCVTYAHSIGLKP